MSKHKQPFKFKHFEVNHHRSSMKVGVDAVILGAWADVSDSSTILDVGCGCGVISLMCAQRNPLAHITGIDLHSESIQEARENFNSSPWSDRLYPILIDFNKFCDRFKGKLDYIISNPPYFDSGVGMPGTVREKARHQGNLSPEIIIERGKNLLSDKGKIGIVIPSEQTDSLTEYAGTIGLNLYRKLIMTGREGRPPKRTFIEFAINQENNPKTECITLEKANGEYTNDYRFLCRDFYLKF